MNGEDMRDALRQAIRLVEELGASRSLMGALTLGVYGQGRATHDVDLLVNAAAEFLDRVRAIAPARGFLIDQGWETYHPNVRDVQVRLNYRGIAIDLMLPRDAHDAEALRRRQQHTMLDESLWVVTPEDFILQKLKAGRPRDFDDLIPFFTRHRDSLEHAYLNEWAMRLGVREELDFLWSQSDRGE